MPLSQPSSLHELFLPLYSLPMHHREAPSQAEKLEAVAGAGPGADDRENASHGFPSETPASIVDHEGNNHVNTDPSTPSDVEAPKQESEKEGSVAPPRSALKNALIMASLCVSNSGDR